MNDQKFPPGWDEERVREVLAHYEDQTEDEQFAEIEAASRSRRNDYDLRADGARARGPHSARTQEAAGVRAHGGPCLTLRCSGPGPPRASWASWGV